MAGPPPDWPKTTYWGALDRAARLWPDAEAVVLPGERITFTALRTLVLRRAANLHRLGLRRGDHVAICMGNSVEWTALLLAAGTLGAVVVPVNTRLRPPEIAYCLRQSDAAFLVMQDRLLKVDFVAMLRGIEPAVDSALPGAALPRLRRLLVLGANLPRAALPHAELDRDPDAGFDPESLGVQPEDAVLIQYTSGTTSAPKGAMLSHDSMLRDAFHVGQRLGLRPGDRYFSQRPLFHVAGVTLSFLAALTAGATYVTTPTFDAALALRMLQAECCTHICGNDTMFLMMLGEPRPPEERIALRGGWAAATGLVMRQAQERFGMPGICCAYGQSEASPNVAMGPFDDDPAKRLEGYAFPLPGLEVRIRHPEEARDCAPGELGEILVRGWALMKGYYNMPEQTARAIDAEGWLHTGDLGVMDEDGRLRFSGRAKELIRVGGENVAPAEVEDVLHAHPAVVQAQVVGVPDPRLVEVPAAYVILRAPGAATPDDLLAWCRERLAGFRVPRHLRIVDSFEHIGMTASAKVQKNKLRDFALTDLGLG
ncbi:class I adenylate-forming enzyme family protein [Falsiroseomonas bella]|uniref:class I adenylate-forming enzyme family protein n=1 Tax=Falsiroseomonas bella TaxID=2184016 RepID=UPI001E3132A1|nr:AMP-binding protein [Falsiroseomonas bella]